MNLTQLNQLYKQQGIALPITLLMLLVMTLLGVASLRTTTLEEQMSANTRLRETAFNAAETTLRFGETQAETLRTLIRTNTLPSHVPNVTLFATTTGNPGWPDTNNDNPGDTCTGGYCIPMQYHASSGTPAGERWEDPNIDVWGTATKHQQYGNHSAANLDTDGVFEAPKYIIEFLGNFPIKDSGGNISSACTPPAGQDLIWPFCQTDPTFFRITARAIAGNAGRQSVVTLQSTIVVP